MTTYDNLWQHSENNNLIVLSLIITHIYNKYLKMKYLIVLIISVGFAIPTTNSLNAANCSIVVGGERQNYCTTSFIRCPDRSIETRCTRSFLSRGCDPSDQEFCGGSGGANEQ